MKLRLTIILIGISYIMHSQEAFQNSGNVQIHQDGQIGFHIDLINNGTFNENLGLAGFYNTQNPLSVSGSEIPRFFDMEVDVINHLFLDINTEVTNSCSYILGDIVTPRDIPTISLDYLSNAFYILENDLKHTDGYSSFSGTSPFIFPIGDFDKFRPLIVPITTSDAFKKAAYFNENPNNPSTFTTTFNTESRVTTLGNISRLEFWDFDGPSDSIITLTWDAESNISQLATDLMNLRVVGWHRTDNEWKDLGNTNFTGDLDQGTITSFRFNPSEFEVVTFGSLIGEDDLIVYNLFSPNGDGQNDLFVIDGIEPFDNILTIYNRWGNLIYKATNYKNTWDGTSEGRQTIDDSVVLPAGTYYYTLELTESKKTSIGWIYVSY